MRKTFAGLFLALGAALFLALGAAPFIVFPAEAQAPGGAVPPLAEDVVAPPPVRDGEVLVHRKKYGEKGEDGAKTSDNIARFRAAYEAHKRPRLALYWNRQLGDTLGEWYGTERVLMTGTGGTSGQGSPFGSATPSPSTPGGSGAPGGWTATGNQQWSIEPQRRAAPGQGRLQPGETWEWEFQDGLLAPLLSANVIVLDRAAITRLTAAGQPPGIGGGEQTLEAVALRGMADLLVEILVAPSGRSTTGYELHGRILDVQTGRIMANINSRHMSGWGQPYDYLASEEGFEKLEDEDDEVTGPRDENRNYKASEDGFTKKRKPPKLRKIAEQFSYNIMNGLLTAWNR